MIRTKCETVSVRVNVIDEVESLEPVLEMAAFFCCLLFFFCSNMSSSSAQKMADGRD